MKIGIMADGYIDANGTIDYLKILLRGIYLRDNVQVYMFFPSENQRRFRHYPLIVRKLYELLFPYQKNSNIDSFAEFNELNIVEYKARELNKKLKEYQIDLIFPSMMDIGRNVPVKWAYEFFDCQHKYYPQYFKRYVRIGRDLFFKTCASHADVTFVNSQNTKKDFSKFYGMPEEKVFVLPFCATLGHDKMGNDLTGIPEKYGIDKPYFLISNQFYAHKRHDVAFKALKQVRDNGHDVMIVCTGLMDEAPVLVKSLKQLCADLGLEDNVKFLGVIPKKDQIELMKNAISVIQPSEFEGDCSGQIIDAITIGQRAIASDLPVIKEVSFYENLCFFKLNDIGDLSERMIEYINTPFNRPSFEELVKKEEAYRKAFSEAIYNVIDRMI